MIQPGLAPVMSTFSRLPRSMVHADNPRIGLANAIPIITGYEWQKIYSSDDVTYRDRAGGIIRIDQLNYEIVFRLRCCKRFNVPITTLSVPGAPLDGSNSYVYPNISAWAKFDLPSAVPTADFVGSRKRWRIVEGKVKKTTVTGVYEMQIVLEARTVPKKLSLTSKELDWPPLNDPVVTEVKEAP